ncbi:hypothetical protein PVAND_006882 [Polypedilum vanderplanki]|uniref:3-beta hydroxysteroid dehydrogenase/isomerase domain-containing protein n=1 Tax=Polypedilum vanderplanki TaxID=319348 RepID=A0A9J6C5J0_POLVA|nr:hypothetical protein PVAND_006882 [Polypedilum vanderplanki]
MSAETANDVILITGGSGFLGQHIVRLIEERDLTVKEIRIVDLRPYENRLNHSEKIKLVSIVGDICDPLSIEYAFEGVDCVFHCAANINFQFPTATDELERVNVTGTQNIIDLCIKYNVPNLIYTSTALVTFIPCMGKGTFSIIVNQTENKAKAASCDSQFLIPGFPASKLRAEKFVLSSYGRKLSNGKGHLKTVSLRPTLMYGEEDQRFFPTIMRFADRWNGRIPRIAETGKKQITYVGNVAWAHLCAMEKLKNEPKNIVGIPIFITDDSPITDTVRLTQRINVDMETFKIKPTSWSIPYLLCYLIAMIIEVFIKVINLFTNYHIEYCPCGMLAAAASFVFYDRLRSSIALEYEPIYSVNEGFSRSAKWYDLWYQQYKDKKLKEKQQ